MTHRRILSLGVLLLVGGAAALSAGPERPTEPTVKAVRKATERFRDVNVALAEGYIPDPTGMCVDAAFEGQPRQLGAMGIHYFRPDLLGITAVAPRVDGVGTHTDFSNPGVLVYAPRADGRLELVAVENLVFRRAWEEAGNTAPPSYLGNEYYPMVDNPYTLVDEAHGFEPHYELHMWLYRDNPAGMFAPFNPKVTCPAPAHEAHGASSMSHVLEGQHLVDPDEVVWNDAPSLAPGAKLAVLEGSAQAAAPFTFRISLPANARIGVHVHPTTERVTVLSGTFHLGIGDTFDESRTRALGAGGLAVMPPGMPMYAFTTEPTVIQINGIGPWGMHYLDVPAAAN